MTGLHVREWGQGDRVALLVHGLSASSRSWWQVGPALAARGYRVLAPDLAGHGDSPRGRYSRERWADDLLSVAPERVELAIGHSLGGVLLAMIVERLRPQRAVYEDPAWYPDSADGYGAVQPAIRAMKDWGAAEIRAASPRWSDEAVRVRLDELARWDPDTTRMEYLETAYAPVFPLVPSLVLRADPSVLIPDDRAEDYRTAGFEIRSVPKTGHHVHADDFDGFITGLDGWL
ncbi:pimeloyl-ACP methyl ester carboxylesterase [Nocardia transvalensis]|uniref:Pimeloyl-ACP methyl ester carboxylesterase n=1 Tax=Nocardia transvalensis TaxID=37333 RepID=A0A7W9PLY8_9NOCA|nr:alpha/beta hydrolase [Nocardia transvalensis]MBB5918594.1 pimeloyl-ACP methyl ester carboxylesterase [Nocardia transvalensis]